MVIAVAMAIYLTGRTSFERLSISHVDNTMPSTIGELFEFADALGYLEMHIRAFLEQYGHADQTSQTGRQAQNNGSRSKNVRRRHFVAGEALA